MNSDDLRKLIQQKISTSPSLRSLMKRIQNGKATFRDTADYSRIYSELLGKCLSDNVLSLDDREAAAADMLRESYGHTNSILSQVQTNIDKKNGINLRPRAAAFPLERVTQFSHSLVDPTVEDSVIKRRARSGTANISMSHHDEYMKTNAEFRSKAGLKCYIDRQTDGKCCKWCTAIAGRYVYGEEPHDVYRRHDNCGCSVIYENGRQRQDVWSKRTWEKTKVGAGASPPTKFTPEQARVLEQEKLRNIHGLSIDNGRGSGIINYARAIDSMFYADDYEFKSYTKEEIIENLKTSAVGLEAIQYLEDNPQVKIKLSEDNERSDRGEHNKNLLTIWLNNCPNVRVAGQTVIHEVTHHRYGIGGSQQAETICFAFEKMHKENRKYLKQEEWDTLVELTKTVYWDLPAVGGVDNLERFDFIVKKG